MISVFVTSLGLIGLSGVLLDSHRRTLRAALADESLDDRDRRFAQSQYRRRMQASAIVGVLGAAIGLGPLVPHDPLLMTIYLTTLVGACAAMMLLALLDVLATRQNFARLRSEQLSAEIELARELSGHDR